MAQVLDFAVRELTKIVEASFDDLLLEITKMDTEQRGLEERLGRSSDRGGRAGGGGGAGGRRRGSENDSMSPSDSEDAREELAEGGVSKETQDREGECVAGCSDITPGWGQPGKGLLQPETLFLLNI